MEASTFIMTKPMKLEEAEHRLDIVLKADPDYYYATATMAQIYLAQKKTTEAKALFCKAYKDIDSKDQLSTTTEIRVKIHLLMVMALCCMHGPDDKQKAEGYLEKARALSVEIPKIGPNACTVFSNLSKRNVSAKEITDHIEKIQDGVFLL